MIDFLKFKTISCKSKKLRLSLLCFWFVFKWRTLPSLPTTLQVEYAKQEKKKIFYSYLASFENTFALNMYVFM